MADLETLISRYLDGELTRAEQDHLQRILAESADARALLREMTAVSRAARRTPLLHLPKVGTEQALFQRLQAEGFHQPATAAPSAVAPSPVGSGWRLARTVLVAAAVMIAFISDSSILNRFGVPGRDGGRDLAMVAGGFRIDRGTAVTVPEARMPGLRNASHAVPVSASAAASALPLPAVSAPAIPSIPANVIVAPEPARTFALVVPPSEQVDPLVSIASIPVPPSLSDRSVEDGPRLAATVRPGLAMIDRQEKAIAEEMSVQIGVEIGQGHQLSLIVGTSPSITETRHENTGEPLSSPAPALNPDEPTDGRHFVGMSAGRSNATPPAEYELRMKNEPWIGVGYNYSISPARRLTVGVGVSAGTSSSAWRVGGELPVRYRVLSGLSIEGAVSVAQVTPHALSLERTYQTDSPDHFVYRTSTERPAFTSYGVQLGIRLDLSGGN